MAQFKFKNKPVFVEAVQYFDEMRAQDRLPEGVYIVPMGDEGDMPIVHTQEAEAIVRHKDWVISGVHGEKSVCKPDVFDKIYEPV